MNLRVIHRGCYTLGPSESDTLIAAVLPDSLWIFYPLLTIALKLRGKNSRKMAVNPSWGLIKADIHQACVQNRVISRLLKPYLIVGFDLFQPLSGFT